MKKILVITLFAFVTACGGGGDTPAPTAPATTPSQKISLEKIQSTTPGTIYTALLKGSWFTSALMNGALSIANKDKVQLNGFLVTPHDMELTISVLGGGTNLIKFTSYIDEDGNVLSMSILNGGVTCTSSSVINIPAFVEVGDIGIISAFTCNNNKTGLASWRIDDAGNGDIHVINNVIVEDEAGLVFSNSDVIFTLSPDGNIVALKLVITLIENILTLTLDSV